MPRSRGSEVPQRQSPRGAMQLRTSSSDSDQSHHRPITDRSPKLGDRRSPRNVQSDTLNQKKLGTRIADLESQLGQAQEELKILKDQLASAEAAKKEAQEELEKKNKKPIDPNSVEGNKQCPDESNKVSNEVVDDNTPETDVYEVEVEKANAEHDSELIQQTDQLEKETKAIEISLPEPEVAQEEEKPSFEDLDMKNEEINLLKSKLEDKEKALEQFSRDNEELKKQLEEANSDLSSSKNNEQERAVKLKQMGEELEASKNNTAQLKETVTTLQVAKEALELEMKKLRVQTEQWRKAADAAAAILAGGADINGRCGSMDKHFGGVFDTPSGGYNGFVGSPGLGDDPDDGFGSVKRKGSGMRMFGDLWKKKSGHK